MARYRRRHDRATPRSWWSLFVRFGGWSALILGLLTVVLSLFSAISFQIADVFDRDGKLVTAIVESKRIEERVKSNDDVETTHYVTLRYKVIGAAGHRSETEVLESFYDGVTEGEERQIRYLVSDPDRVEVELGLYRRSARVMNRIGLVVGVAGLAALYLLGMKANRAIKVRRDGQKRYATVTSIRDEKRRLRGRRKARLQWREDDGAVGESLPHNDKWLRDRYTPGDKIVVFRLGKHVFWEGDVGPPRREVDLAESRS